MARFKLIRTPMGLMLTTDQPLSPAATQSIRRAFETWKTETPDGVLIAADTEFIDLDLPVELSLPVDEPLKP